VSEHRTEEFDPGDHCCTRGPAAPPKRVAGAELQQDRRLLCAAAYKFLVRCVNAELMDVARWREACADIEVGIVASDLKRRPQRSGACILQAALIVE
jgi:hypothetical protein